MSSEMLKKKGVPDWLNSSLWSSNPAPQEDQRLLRHTPKPETLAPPEPSPPPSPPPQTLPKQEERPTTEPDEDHPTVHDPKLPAFSVEEISRQAQLLAEVWVRVRVSDFLFCLLFDGLNSVSLFLSSVVSVFCVFDQLSRKVVSLTEVRRLASQGIPDGAGIRSTVWKILLGYLPADRGLWVTELAKKRDQYALFKEELLVNPSEIARRLDKSIGNGNEVANCEGSGMLPRSEITHGEHPLSLGKTSVWNQFFQDSEIIEQIDRDVMRTHPDLHFFSGDSSFAKSNQEALRHILIVFAKLNPGIRYVQGMNEVLAPLFYVFRNDPDEENAASAEADTFFCFVEVLSGFRDHFCQQLDNSVVGIRSTITRLSQLLKEHDEELWRHLEVTTKVNPQFYAFRWITLLLTQEFNFADSLHIWDTLLSDPEGPQETLLRICCAMLILIRRRLLAGDFTSNLKLLQNYPSANISHLLYVADKLRARPAA